MLRTIFNQYPYSHSGLNPFLTHVFYLKKWVIVMRKCALVSVCVCPLCTLYINEGRVFHWLMRDTPLLKHVLKCDWINWYTRTGFIEFIFNQNNFLCYDFIFWKKTNILHFLWMNSIYNKKYTFQLFYNQKGIWQP